MKLVTFRAYDKVRAGFWLDGVGLACDLHECASLVPDREPMPCTIRELVSSGRMDEARRIEQITRGVAEAVPGALTGLAFEMPDVEWLPPIPDPSKIIAIGLNYKDHCEEQGLPPPTFPTVFAKLPNSLAAQDADVIYPRETTKLDYEAELAFVIGRLAKRVAKEDALDFVAGYMCLNDITARDIQKSEGQWIRGKSFDTFCPCGPYLVTPDEVPDLGNLAIQCKVNGETRQDSNTSQLIFGVADLVSRLSSSFTLYPGDIVTTGTPGGVGMYRGEDYLLKVGDTVEVTIERLGTLRNRVVAEPT